MASSMVSAANMTRLPGLLLLVALWSGWGPILTAAADGNFTAVWVDGTRTEGDEVVDWNSPEAKPKLADRLLFESKSPLRWLRDNRVEPSAVPEAYVEFLGGDRLPGKIVAWDRGSDVPYEPSLPHLLVETLTPVELPGVAPRGHVRVRTDWVRRIVWQRRGSSRFQPGTVFQRDGRQVSFRSLRWGDGQVRLLLDDGTSQLTFDQIAELHLPLADPSSGPWEAHYEQLASLCPSGTGRLMTVDVEGGLKLTTSLARFEARAVGDPGDPKNWVHMMQPAWSPDALFIPHRQIRQRTFFNPAEVPLTWIEPSRNVQQGALATSWRGGQSGASTYGTPLASAGQDFGWGFGVHAHNELEFPLPPLARSFRTRVGLDEVAGAGGCALGRIYLEPTTGEPLFESPLLIGAQKNFDSGRLELISTSPKSVARLLLVADAAEDDRPEGADPLDIRDAVDWLEPMLELDEALLQAEIHKRASEAMPGVQGWSIAGKYGTDWKLVNQLFSSESAAPAFHLVLLPQGKPLQLSKRFRPTAEADSLAVLCNRADQRSTPSRMEVFVNDKRVTEFPVPESREGRQPVFVSLREYRQRDIEVVIKLIPTDDRSAADWHGAGLVDQAGGKKEAAPIQPLPGR
jgi:hypothetical protein